MERDEVMTQPDRFWSGQPVWDRAAAVVDLETAPEWPCDLMLPPCPLIGIGSRDAPGAERVDLVIEPPATLDSVLAQIADKPLAAAAVVQLLRIVPSLSLDQALSAESFAYAMAQGSAEHREWMAQNARAVRAPSNADAASCNAVAVRLQRRCNVLAIALDRPKTGNAIDREMRDALVEAFQLAALDPTIERVVLSGKGKVFSLGADLAEFGTTSDPAIAHAIRAVTLPARWAARISGKLEARVQGGCVGAGLEIAAFAKRIVALPKAWFQLPELAMGVLPGAGGCVSVTQRIGRQRAALMVLSGKRLSAQVALEWGLIDAIVDDLS